MERVCMFVGPDRALSSGDTGRKSTVVLRTETEDPREKERA